MIADPNDDGMFILDADASNTGIGGVLSQIQWCDKAQKYGERPVFYASKSLTKVQRRYCVTRRELLAVVTFVLQFKHFLLGRKFIIRTDHSSLRQDRVLIFVPSDCKSGLLQLSDLSSLSAGRSTAGPIWMSLNIFLIYNIY